MCVFFTFQLSPDFGSSGSLEDAMLRELNRMTGKSVEDSSEMINEEAKRHKVMVPFVVALAAAVLSVLLLYPICFLCLRKPAKRVKQ